MKQLSEEEKKQFEREFIKRFRKTGFETNEGILYPETCEMGKLYSPEECERLGILT